jgi:hypothetical protein
MCTIERSETGMRIYTDFITHIKSHFKLRDDGFQPCTDFIGMNISWNQDGSAVRIDQRGYVADVLETHGFSECRTHNTPAEAKVLVSDLDSPPDGPEGDAERAEMKDKPYRARIGALLWIARVSRPDITHAVNALTRVASNPGIKHWHATSRVLRYLAATLECGLVFRRDRSLLPGQFKPVGFTDSDYAPDWGTAYDNYRSTTGWVYKLNGTALSWRSRRQEGVPATSSSEAEWYAAADAAKESVFVRRVVEDLGNVTHGPINLYADNQSAIKCSENAADQERQKHTRVRAQYLRQLCRGGQLRMGWVPGSENDSDQFTKPLPGPAFTKLSARLGLEEASTFGQ